MIPYEVVWFGVWGLLVASLGWSVVGYFIDRRRWKSIGRLLTVLSNRPLERTRDTISGGDGR